LGGVTDVVREGNAPQLHTFEIPGEIIMLNHIRNIITKRDEDGASAVEYGLLVAAIAAVIVIIVFALGGLIKDAFSKTCNSISTGSSVAANCT
jgi:pilus assembly protein Flp/PilA